MNLLSRYIVGLYLRTFALSLAGAIVLLIVIEFFGRIGDFAPYNSQPTLVATYFALRTPKWLVDVFPAASLLAVLLGVGSMVQTGEVVAMQACGVGIARIARPLLGTAIALSGLTMLWNEVVVPPASGRARQVKNVDIKDMGNRGQLDTTALWLQVPGGFLNIDYFNGTRNELEGITLHGVDERFHLRSVIEIPGAAWKDDHWEYEGGTVREFGADGDGSSYAPLGDRKVDLGGTPTEFQRKAPRSDEFNMRRLAERVRTLEAKGLDPSSLQTDLHFKVAQPLSGILTVLIGLPLALRGSRRGGSAQHIGTGMAICFLYWLMQALTVSAGHAGTLSPAVAAWSANAVFLLVGGLLALRS